MNAVLYLPGLGYYRSGAQKFGAGGDFITAPDISPHFTRCLADFLITCAPQQHYLEVGAGNGVLAAGLLQAMASQNCLPEQYLILEVSEELRHRQMQTISEYLRDDAIRRVTWIDDFPDDFDGVVFANELLDAMPVRRFQIHNETVYEQFVVADETELGFEYQVADEPRLKRRVADLDNQYRLAEAGDYLSEVNFIAEDWIRTLGSKLHSALVLLIDYGYPRSAYYHPQRRLGTLMCHYQHKAHPEPLILPGIQDITAHVDFTAIADAALDVDMDVLGFTTQAHFLMDNGLLTHLDESEHTSTDFVRSASDIKRLTLPGEMGEQFKVLALGKQWRGSIRGFETHDMRHLL